MGLLHCRDVTSCLSLSQAPPHCGVYCWCIYLCTKTLLCAMIIQEQGCLHAL